MAGPMLKFKNEEKLHISKGPGIKSWGILTGLLVLGLGSAVCLSDSMIVKSLSILACLILGLIFMDEWEDCVMDRFQDKVTLTRSNWYDRLCCRVPEQNTRVLPLSNIIGVQSMGNEGLFFILSSGCSTPVTRHPVDYREGIKLSNHISSFLRLDRVEPVAEYLDFYGEDWDDAESIDASGSENSSTRRENTPPPPLLLVRQRDEIKVLSEPLPPQVSPQ